jgi:hypothetical protein
MEITLTISQTAVMKEVATTTTYTGAKKIGDEGAMDRISTVDEDNHELKRFWDESRAELAQAFVRLLVSEGMNGDEYELKLNVSNSFDTALEPSMVLGLFSYFVQNITGKWYVYTNKEEAKAFVERGSALLDEVKQKAFYKKMPTRPRYD